MIKEIYTGHPLLRAVDRFIGDGTNRREYLVPDNVDFIIDQPKGIRVIYRGPKDNFAHSVSTPQGVTIDFATLAPFPIGFNIEEGKDAYGYIVDRRNKKVGVPSNLHRLQRDPVLIVLHEIGHFWSYHETQWVRTHKAALSLVQDWTIPRSSREDSLPFDSVRREQEIKAWKTSREEERRAWGAAFYIVYRLRQMGIDLVPHRKSVSSLTKAANRGLGTYIKKFEEINTNKIKLDPRFRKDEARDIVSGNLPWPELKALIDKKFDLNTFEAKI